MVVEKGAGILHFTAQVFASQKKILTADSLSLSRLSVMLC